jgi:hypothetical protein
MPNPASIKAIAISPAIAAVVVVVLIGVVVLLFNYGTTPHGTPPDWHKMGMPTNLHLSAPGGPGGQSGAPSPRNMAPPPGAIPR